MGAAGTAVGIVGIVDSIAVAADNAVDIADSVVVGIVDVDRLAGIVAGIVVADIADMLEDAVGIAVVGNTVVGAGNAVEVLADFGSRAAGLLEVELAVGIDDALAHKSPFHLCFSVVCCPRKG